MRALWSWQLSRAAVPLWKRRSAAGEAAPPRVPAQARSKLRHKSTGELGLNSNRSVTCWTGDRKLTADSGGGATHLILKNRALKRIRTGRQKLRERGSGACGKIYDMCRRLGDRPVGCETMHVLFPSRVFSFFFHNTVNAFYNTTR